MDYSFARQLLTISDAELGEKIYKMLSDAGIEVFIEGDKEGTFPNMHSGDEIPGGRMYVTAADREMALSMIEQEVPGELITPEADCVPKSIMTEEEKVYAAARRKRKWLYIECGIVILIAFAILYLR